jgi:hypothetical protein
VPYAVVTSTNDSLAITDDITATTATTTTNDGNEERRMMADVDVDDDVGGGRRTLPTTREGGFYTPRELLIFSNQCDNFLAADSFICCVRERLESAQQVTCQASVGERLHVLKALENVDQLDLKDKRCIGRDLANTMQCESYCVREAGTNWQAHTVGGEPEAP